MKRFIFFSLTLFSLYNSFAQRHHTLNGTVIDQKTQKAIPFASVFLEGTTFGTHTDSLGIFRIKNIVDGQYRLVVSMVGYKTVLETISIEKSITLPIITLNEDNVLLDEVKIVGNKDIEWEKRYKTFEKAFLGEDYNKREVILVNREVIDFQFDNEKKVLKAKANQPIIIENKTLGYRINYTLQDFELDNKTTSYRGLTHFEFLTPTDEKEAETWIKNRKTAYKGSINHFLNALINNNLKKEGFDAFYLNANYVNISGKSPLFYDMSSKRHFPVNPLEFVKNNPTSWRNIQIKYPIEVIYTKKTVSKPIFQDAPFAYSIIIQKDKTTVNENGFIDNPYAFELKGDMGKKAMKDLLPIDYSLSEENKKNN